MKNSQITDLEEKRGLCVQYCLLGMLFESLQVFFGLFGLFCAAGTRKRCEIEGLNLSITLSSPLRETNVFVVSGSASCTVYYKYVLDDYCASRVFFLFCFDLFLVFFYMRPAKLLQTWGASELKRCEYTKCSSLISNCEQQWKWKRDLKLCFEIIFIYPIIEIWTYFVQS